MNSLTEKKWFTYLNDRQEGPFALDEIRSKISEGIIRSENYLWCEGMQDWTIVRDVPDLRTPESPRQSMSSDLGPSISVNSMTVSEKTSLLEEVAPPTHDPLPVPQLEETLIQLPPASQKRYFLKSNLFKWTALFTVVGGGTLAIVGGGYLKLGKTDLQKVIKKMSETSRPMLLSASEKFPFLSQWISPLPPLPDLSPEDFEELKSTAREKPEVSGGKISLALSRDNPTLPKFYLASNLGEGLEFKLYIVGKSDTLLNQLSFQTQTQVKITKKLGTTPEITAPDGKPIPHGDYLVYVTVPDGLGAADSTAFAPLMTPVPPELPKNTKIIAQKQYFLGGIKNAVYLDRLKEFHNKLQLEATREISEIKQFTATLESQFKSSQEKFNFLKKPKITAKQKKQWDAFHTEWSQLSVQLEQIFSRWKPEIIQKEYFYTNLYELTQQAGQEIQRVHALQNSYFSSGGSRDLRTFDIQLGSALSATESALSLLKTKTEQMNSLQPTLNGMPRREGL